MTTANPNAPSDAAPANAPAAAPPTVATPAPPPRPAVPVYVKTKPNMKLPADPYYRLLTRSGVMTGRNTPFYASLVPAPDRLNDLAAQEPMLLVRFPLIQRGAFERVIGFFDAIARSDDAEAAVLILWDVRQKVYRYVVPEQISSVSVGEGRPLPLNLYYDVPVSQIPQHWQLIGDFHSHVYEYARPSHIDVSDERSGGLHIIIGRLDHRFPKLPDIHIDVVVDGMRFTIGDPQDIIDLEGYRGPIAQFPQSWLSKVRVKRYVYHASDDTRDRPQNQGNGGVYYDSFSTGSANWSSGVQLPGQNPGDR